MTKVSYEKCMYRVFPSRKHHIDVNEDIAFLWTKSFLPTSKVRSFMPYSWVPNKQGVLNKRGGQKMSEKLISELGLNKRGGGSENFNTKY